jgi:transposase
MGGRFAGIDWAKDDNVVCVVDEAGKVVAEGRFGTDQAGVDALVGELGRHQVTRLAIERPDGVLIERLLEGALEVLAIHPNQVKAHRGRFRAAAGKSDRFDAFVLAELCRTDAHRFPALRPDSDLTRALRALTRHRQELVGERVRLANRLRAELERSWPGAAQIFSEVDSPIALAFLTRYPAPADARRLGEKRLAAFLARHAYCGRRSPRQLLERLAGAPRAQLGQVEAEMRRDVVLDLVGCLEPVVERIRRATSQIAHLLEAHPDGELFRSLFRDPKSVVTAAELLAEIGDARERYPHPQALAAEAGMSPVAVESGRQKAAVFRWACDKRLRRAVGVLADASRHHNAWAAEVYAKARARGKDHPHAIRILGRAWITVIWRLWQDGMPYDPAKHRALQAVLAQRG